MESAEPTNQQPINDDQELAKVLAGVSQQADETPAVDTSVPVVPPVDDAAASDTSAPAAKPAAEVAAPAPVSPPASGELDSVKQEALNELRPLVDKLDVPPEEKFDTYLLLLRSTDDKELISPAHEAAKNIADEGRRAQALLDIIKEIDFLSQN